MISIYKLVKFIFKFFIAVSTATFITHLCIPFLQVFFNPFIGLFRYFKGDFKGKKTGDFAERFPDIEFACRHKSAFLLNFFLKDWNNFHDDKKQI